jgi:hypothetical protein
MQALEPGAQGFCAGCHRFRRVGPQPLGNQGRKGRGIGGGDATAHKLGRTDAEAVQVILHLRDGKTDAAG